MTRKLLLTLLLCFFSLQIAEAKLTLFKNGKSSYCIALCSDASISEQTAANELQHYIKEISGVVLPIKKAEELKSGERHIFVGYNAEYGQKLGVTKPQNNDEAYTYRTLGDNIWIYGGAQRGTIYGVYSFLENELGVRWFT
ncbi:MAG: hypothetical protein IKZ11_03155, partial [Alistipes sp.]|nr:hypothetical protein [Alistipes sp.]